MSTGLEVVWGGEDGEVVESKARSGSFVRAGAVLLVYRTAAGETRRLNIPGSGVLKLEPGVKKGQMVNKNTVVARVRECEHDIVIKDMCGTCGKDLREKGGLAGQRVEATVASIPMIHHVPELIVSDKLAKKIGNRDQQLLLETRRLVLLVDLDQTLIHTTNQTFDMKDAVDVVHYKLRGTHFYTKIRPYARAFLKRMSELYEMHIISYGERQYAHKIAQVLDPDQLYFGHRILSRDELFSAIHKTGNLNALFPCGDQLIAIIDDRPDVWQFSDALVQVKPYRFFKETGDINAPGTANVLQSVQEATASCVNDETLEYIAMVLTRIHAAFYGHHDQNKHSVQDVKQVISHSRGQVLRGCTVVFSGIVPIGMDVHNSEAYHLCIQFGAVVSDCVSDNTTHLIAARWGTTKVHEARKRAHVSVVTPRWLYACVERWERADEHEFLLTREMMSSREEPLRSLVVDRQLSDMPTLAKATLRTMTDEVDEVLTEDDSDIATQQHTSDSVHEEPCALGKRSGDAVESKTVKRVRQREDSWQCDSDSEMEDMANELEREFARVD